MDRDAAIYKITATDDKGNEIVAYVTDEARTNYVRSMSSEYGSLKIEKLTVADVPSDVELR
jgi:hypothetical protein